MLKNLILHNVIFYQIYFVHIKYTLRVIFLSVKHAHYQIYNRILHLYRPLHTIINPFFKLPIATLQCAFDLSICQCNFICLQYVIIISIILD